MKINLPKEVTEKINAIGIENSELNLETIPEAEPTPPKTKVNGLTPSKSGARQERQAGHKISLLRSFNW